MYKNFVGSSVLLLVICIMATNTFANPYVKNLHKACAKQHQDCAIECAEKSLLEDEYFLSENALKCANNCRIDYDSCEKLVMRTIELTKTSPITLDRHPAPFTDQEVTSSHRQRLIEMGKIIVEDNNL